MRCWENFPGSKNSNNNHFLMKIGKFKIKGTVKSKEFSFFVIPAEAGIQEIQIFLDSCFRRSDNFSDFLRDYQN
jgi:hypothetical protein